MIVLGEAMSGRDSFVLISGEAGVDKTGLPEEFEKMSGRTGVRSLIGRRVPGMPSPYGRNDENK